MLKWENILTDTPVETSKSTFLVEEPNSTLYAYYLQENVTQDQNCLITLGDYSSPPWSDLKQSLTNKKVDRIGVIHFPQVGAMAFWSLLNEQKCQILAPVHHEVVKYPKPNFTVQETADSLIFHMSPPEEIHVPADISHIVGDVTKYMCYRVVLRLDAFALEYITYEETLEVPKPATTGTYDIYCVGYIHEGEAVSEDSDHVELFIQGVQDTWPGPEASSDVCITDIAITEDNKIRVTRSDGHQITSDKAVNTTDIYPVSAMFSSDGFLTIVLNNGQSIKTDNSIPVDTYVNQIQELEDTLAAAAELVDEINGEVV